MSCDSCQFEEPSIGFVTPSFISQSEIFNEDLDDMAQSIISRPYPQALKQIANDYLSGRLQPEEFMASFTSYQIKSTVTNKFETFFPKQTEQLIKIGQDTTRLGSKISEIDKRELQNDSEQWEKITYLDQRFNTFKKDDYDPFKADVHSKLTALGESSGGDGGFLTGLLGGLGGGSLIALGLIAFIMLKK